MILPSLNDFFATEEPPKVCIGRKYKCVVNPYVANGGTFTTKTSMILVKRLSCRGCEHCGWEEDELHELVACGGIPIMNIVEHNGLYELKIVNQHRDWESGCIDDYDLEFVHVGKYKPGKQEKR